MLCARTQDWLLNAEIPREIPDAPELVLEHLATCTDCLGLMGRLQRVEAAWHAVPTPVVAMKGCVAFLRRHGDGRRPTSPRRTKRSSRMPWAIALALVFLIGTVGAIWYGIRSNSIEEDVFDRLIDWNLRLSETASLQDRRALYVAQAPKLRQCAESLTEEDRPFAEMLLQTGDWLTNGPEPLDVADRFTNVADQLVDRITRAAARSNEIDTARIARQYQFVSSRGISAKLQQRGGAFDPLRSRRVDRLQARENKRYERLERLYEVAPEPARKALRKLLYKHSSDLRRVDHPRLGSL